MKTALLLGAALCATLTAQAQATFSTPTPYPFNAQGFRAVTADLNRDQYPDIIIAGGAANVVAVLLNNGTGGFAPAQLYPTGDFCSGVAVTAVNCDVYPDLLVSNANDGNVQVLLGSAAGTFTAGTTYPITGTPMDVVAADFNKDSRPDLAAVNKQAGTVLVRLHQTASTCTELYGASTSYATNTGPLSADMLKVVDVNHDTRPDLVVVNQANQAGLSVLLGTADGFSTPTAYATGTPFTYDAAFADISGDGLADAVVSAPDNSSIAVLTGASAAPWFSSPTTYVLNSKPLGVTVADFDKDGKLDVATITQSGDVVILPGKGSGVLGTDVNVATVANANWILAADFNQDGKVDLATVQSGAVKVLLNSAVLATKSVVATQRALYPNPCPGGNFHLTMPGVVHVYDLAGRTVSHEQRGDVVSLASAAPGLYVVEINNGRLSSRQTLVVQ